MGLLFDPTFTVQTEPPNTMAAVSSWGGLSEQSVLAFQKRNITCWPCTYETFAAGEQVNLVTAAPNRKNGFLKFSDGYPTRWPRPVQEWRGKPASTFLRYVEDKNPRWHTFAEGVVEAVLDGLLMQVFCLEDNRSRTLRTAYLQAPAPTVYFQPGDHVCIYRQSETSDRIVIGFLQEPRGWDWQDDLNSMVAGLRSPFGTDSVVDWAGMHFRWSARGTDPLWPWQYNSVKLLQIKIRLADLTGDFYDDPYFWGFNMPGATFYQCGRRTGGTMATYRSGFDADHVWDLIPAYRLQIEWDDSGTWRELDNQTMTTQALNIEAFRFVWGGDNYYFKVPGSYSIANGVQTANYNLDLDVSKTYRFNLLKTAPQTTTHRDIYIDNPSILQDKYVYYDTILKPATTNNSYGFYGRNL